LPPALAGGKKDMSWERALSKKIFLECTFCDNGIWLKPEIYKDA
jgi:hypothetical protein